MTKIRVPFLPLLVLAGALAALASASPRRPAAHRASAPSDTTITITSILGVWHGRSDCLQKGTACKDEIVEYHFEPVPGAPDSVSLDAMKLVAGRYESMGILGFAFEASTRTWFAEFQTPRAHILWSFQIAGRNLVGSCVGLPDRTPLRRVAAVRGLDPNVKGRR